MSREEKEKLLNEKMENIRKRNEELRKRHEEIEADKKNADKFSSTVTMDKVKPYVMKAPRTRPEKSERHRELTDQPPPPRPSDIMPARQRLSESDGPPPDPSYRFLSDPDRDGSEKEKKRDGRSKRRGKQGCKEDVCEGGLEEDGNKLDWEGDKLDVSQSETSSENTSSVGHGNRGNSRGKGKYEITNGWGRGRGRGRGYDRAHQEHEYVQQEDVLNISPSEGSDGARGKGKVKLSFASRDIRYFPDEGEDQRVGKDGRMRGRGRQNFNQWSYSDDSQNKARRHGNFEQRGKGRGRNRDQQKEYERWKAERAAIDEARLTRGKTDGGSWRREWDNDKMSQGEVDESEPVYDPRFPRSKSENFKLADLINLSDNEGSSQQSGKQEDGMQRESRFGRGRGSREKFVKVDTDQLKMQLEQKVDEAKDLERKMGQMTNPGYTEEISKEEIALTFADVKEDSEDIPAQNVSSTTEVVKDILHDSLDNDKEATNVEVIDECGDKDYQKFEEETETDCQSVASGSLTITGDELAAASLKITNDELASGK